MSFTDYVLSFFHDANVKVISISLLTILLIFNIRGVKVAARFQNILVILLILALLTFGIIATQHIRPVFFNEPGFIINGYYGIMTADSLMSFATVGSAFVVNFSAFFENPKKDIPFAIIVSSIIVGIIYILVAFVASGVLPIEYVSGKPLSFTAKLFLPTPSIYFLLFL